MYLAIAIVALVVSIANLTILVFLSIFIVRFRDSLLNKKDDKKISDTELQELDSVSRRLNQEINLGNSSLLPYGLSEINKNLNERIV